MLAPRGAALLLLHLALQPWLGSGAQATPQGKWERAGAGATGQGPSVTESAVPRSTWANGGTSSARGSAPGSWGLARHLSVFYCDWKR